MAVLVPTTDAALASRAMAAVRERLGPAVQDAAGRAFAFSGQVVAALFGTRSRWRLGAPRAFGEWLGDTARGN